MKKIICHFLFLFILCGAVYAKSLTFTIDPQATKQASWAVDSKMPLPFPEGMANSYDSFNPDGTHSMVYRLFKGITTDGHCLVQDYYEKGDIKRTEPFLVQCEDAQAAFIWITPETLVGPLVYYAPDGSKYSEGQYQQGKMQGVWQFWKNNQKEMLVSFNKDELKGKWQTWHSNGAKWVEGEFASNTIKTGLWRVWGDKNNLRLQGNYVDNLAQGIWQAWHNNGKLAWKGNYLNGVRLGKWTWWHNNGVKSREIIYDEGAPVTLEAQWNNQAKAITQLKQPINRAKTQAQTKLSTQAVFEGYTGPIAFDDEGDAFPHSDIRYQSYRKYWGVTDNNLCVVQDFYHRVLLSAEDDVDQGQASAENNNFLDDGYAHFYNPRDALLQLPSILGSEHESDESDESDVKMSDPFAMPCDALINYEQEGDYIEDTPTIPYQYTYTGWYPNGKKAMEGLIVNGIKQGVWTTWHDNGTKASQGQYIDHQKQGEWIHWYNNGNKKTSQFYEKGNKDGEFIVWYENGKLWQKGFYSQNQRAKLWAQWNDKGEKQWEGNYQANKRTGQWQHWDVKGQLITDSYQPIIDTVATAELQHMKIGDQLVRASPYYVRNPLTQDNWLPDCSMVSRRFLGITVDNYYLVQEFGECRGRRASNGVAITEPFVLTDYQALYDTRSLWRFDRTIDGRYTVYHVDNPKQKQWQVHYNKGQAEGLWTKWDSNGNKIREGFYSNGRAEGVWTQWDSSGQKTEELIFKRGFLQGVYKKWYPTGKLAEQGEYKNGAKIGLWQGWYQNGQLNYQRSYDSSPGLNRSITWFDNGQISSEVFYDGQGRKQGAQTYWYKNGNKKSLDEYKDDEPHGHWDVWYENGQKRLERVVYNGKNQGLYTLWHSNGQIERQMTLKDDKPVQGAWASYNYNGHLTGFGYYDNEGNPDGVSVLFYDNLQIREFKFYIHGKYNGLAMEWFDSGQLKSYQTYRNNHLQGYAFYWFANGQMQYEMTYDWGKLHGKTRGWHENGKQRLLFYYEHGNQVNKPDSFFKGNK